jgi:hypothetical protein
LDRHVARSGRNSHLQALTLFALALLVSDCGGNRPAASKDAGDATPACTGNTVCDRLTVKACTENVVGTMLADCSSEGACSGGRCMSPACADAERNRTSFVGCLFYTVEADNVASDVDAATSFLVTNPGVEAAKVTLQQPLGGGAWSAPAPISVPGGKSARLPAPGGLQVTAGGSTPRGGLRLTSNRPVTVAQIESDDGTQSALSSGGTMLLPAHVLGPHYFAITYPQVQTPALASTAGMPTGAGRVLVVGTQESTNVTLTVPPNASAILMDGLPPSMRGVQQTYTLGDGDVVQIWSANEGDDLSGTEINADKPVAVFSGNMTTTYGRTADGIHTPDMAHEQMPPVFAWSLKWVAASLPPQAGTCDALLGAGVSLWRFIVAMPRTRVDIMGPAGPIIMGATLDPGHVLELPLKGDFVANASGPLLVTQGIDCEPTLSLAISADKLLQDLRFAVLPSFDQMIAVARLIGDPVMLDGTTLDASMFVRVGGGFEVARVTLPVCPASQQTCTHRLQGRFGMTLRGMDVVASYALTAPAWAGCIDSLDPACLN